MLSSMETEPNAAPVADPTPDPTPPKPSPAPPPASQIVVEARRSEREVELEREISDLRAKHDATEAAKRAREIRISELEDENHRLKSIPKPPAPPKRRPLLFPTVLDQED